MQSGANVLVVECGAIPRDAAVQQAEALGKTVLEALPESPLADCYRKLAAQIMEVCRHDVQ